MNSDQNSPAVAPQRVAVLGGGPSSLAAAYWLTGEEQNNRYEVTIYSQGWRLGGKCASGRNAQANNAIEEHGLHLLMGCYQNAFATMRSCYQDWRKLKPDPDNMLQTWEDAFQPQRLVTLMSRDGAGQPPSWSPWNFPFPKFPGEPGDGPLVPGSANSSITAFEELLDRMSNQLLDCLRRGKGSKTGGALPVDEPPPYYQETSSALGAMQAMFLSNSPEPTRVAAKLRKAANAIEPSVKLLPPNHHDDAEFMSSPMGSIEQDAKRLAILADLGVAIALGYVSDIFARGEAGFEAINQLDLRAWLSKHGATDHAVNSAPINAFYDLTFAAEKGDSNGPASIAAGVSIRTMLEMTFGYANAPLWKMMAGMGDIVCVPLYEVLLARGVRFEFFHRVEALRTSGEQLDEIVVSKQADTVTGEPYQPLTRIDCTNGKQLDVWLNQPHWEQLKNGAELKAKDVDFEYSGCTVSTGTVTLKAGEDFDLAISGIPPMALFPLAQDLVTKDKSWSTALSASVSVATQSLQLWMKPDVEKLGWTDGDTILTAYAEPYDSWGDMSQVIPAESWSIGDAPGSVGYFCGTMEIPDGGVSLSAMTAIANSNATVWMDGELATLWPNIGADPASSSDIVDRYVRANFDLSEQYVQTPAGNNVDSRFDPSNPASLPNFYVVGDWTRTRFSGGCFESAVESGMLASRGISGFPKSIKTLHSL